MFKRSKINSILMLLALMLFEIFSFSSTRTALYSLMHMQSWSTLLAYAFVAIDFAGVGLLFFGDTKKLGEENVWRVTAAWILTAFGDTYMTYFNVATSMQARSNHIMVTSGTISLRTFQETIPILVAVIVWLVQVGLVHSLNMVVAELMEASRTKRPRPQTAAMQAPSRREPETHRSDVTPMTGRRLAGERRTNAPTANEPVRSLPDERTNDGNERSLPSNERANEILQIIDRMFIENGGKLDFSQADICRRVQLERTGSETGYERLKSYVSVVARMWSPKRVQMQA